MPIIMRLAIRLLTIVGLFLGGGNKGVSQEFSANLNEFTRSYFAARAWLSLTENHEGDASYAKDVTRVEIDSTRTSARQVQEGWHELLRKDPLVFKAIEYASLWARVDSEAQMLRRRGRVSLGQQRFDTIARQAQNKGEFRSYSWIDLTDRDLVRLCLWGHYLAHCNASRLPLEDDHEVAFHWMVNDLFLRTVTGDVPPPGVEEAIAVFRKAVARSNALNQHSAAIPAVVKDYLVKDSQAGLASYLGRNYLNYRLRQMPEIKLAEKAFKRGLEPLLQRDDSIADRLSRAMANVVMTPH
ncbi:MAG: hypothetical protein AAGD07_01770 [Planctomycetota bacterium]